MKESKLLDTHIEGRVDLGERVETLDPTCERNGGTGEGRGRGG